MVLEKKKLIGQLQTRTAYGKHYLYDRHEKWTFST
jgi:hypothetical protein